MPITIIVLVYAYMLICLKNFRTAHVKSPESNSNMDWISARWRSVFCSLALGSRISARWRSVFCSLALGSRISARWRSVFCSLALGFLFPLPFFLMFWSISLARQKSQAGTPIPQR